MSCQKIYNAALANLKAFREEKAKKIAWYEFYKSILSTDEDGLYRWHKGGKLNT